MRPLILILALTGLVAGAQAQAASVNVACGVSLSAAYHAAAPGDVLTLSPACNYGAQTITFDQAKVGATDRVVLQASSGTTFTDITIRGAQHLELRDFVVTGPRPNGDIFMCAQNCSSGGALATDIVVVNPDALNFFARNGQQIQLLGGEIHGMFDGTSPTIGMYPGLAPSFQVVIDGAHFHDIGRVQQGVHVECLFIQGSDQVTIRNSHFGPNCGIMDVFLSPMSADPAPSHVTLSGNTFDTPAPERGAGAVVFNTDGKLSTGGLIQGNTWNDRFYLENAGSPGPDGWVWCNDNTGSAPFQENHVMSFQDCGAPPPPPPPPTTTTAPTTTTEPPPPPPAYHPACEPDCDTIILALRDRLAQIHGLSAP